MDLAPLFLSPSFPGIGVRSSGSLISGVLEVVGSVAECPESPVSADVRLVGEGCMSEPGGDVASVAGINESGVRAVIGEGTESSIPSTAELDWMGEGGGTIRVGMDTTTLLL